MKSTSYIVAIAIGLALALSPTLVMAKTSAGKSAKSCGNDKPGANLPEFKKPLFSSVFAATVKTGLRVSGSLGE